MKSKPNVANPLLQNYGQVYFHVNLELTTDVGNVLEIGILVRAKCVRPAEQT